MAYPLALLPVGVFVDLILHSGAIRGKTVTPYACQQLYELMIQCKARGCLVDAEDKEGTGKLQLAP